MKILNFHYIRYNLIYIILQNVYKIEDNKENEDLWRPIFLIRTPTETITQTSPTYF